MRTRLSADPSNVRTARLFVEQALVQASLPDLIDLVTLLTSELVTNAFLHAKSSVELVVEPRGACVRVEVGDHGPGTPLVQPRDLTTTGGRGMALLDTLANDWGVSLSDGRKVVWFELCRAAH